MHGVTIEEAFELAWKQHQGGALAQAEQIYRQIVQAAPDHARSWAHLGVACMGQGKFAEAAHCFERVVQLQPDQAEAHNNLAIALAEQGRLEEAIGCFRQALERKPNSAEVLNNLGATLVRRGQFEEAIASFRSALRHQPDYAEAHHNLGSTLADQGQLEEATSHLRWAVKLKPNYAAALNSLARALLAVDQLDEAFGLIGRALQLQPGFAAALNNLGLVQARRQKLDDAIACYEQAIRLQPNFAEAQTNRGLALLEQGKLEEAVAGIRQALQGRRDFPEGHNNLGLALYRQGKLEEAIASYQEALRLRPGYAEAHNNLGNALTDQGRLNEAIAHFHEALRTRPNYAEAHSNLGSALKEQGQLAEAALEFRRALELKPDFASAHNNLGAVLAAQGQVDEAMTCYERALKYKPDYADVHFNRALALLPRGRFREGWPEYEWRWQLKDFARRSLRQPRWDGGPLAGRTLLVHAEQGLGDSLHFVRYLPLVKRLGSTILFECPKPLLALLAGFPGVDRLIPSGEPLPDFDLEVPLLSLPGLLGTTLETIPAQVPYLSADAELVASWRAELSQVPGFKIAIAWQGNPKHREDRHRSIPLAQFAPLARVPGVKLVSLQKGPGSEQVQAVPGSFEILDLAGRLDEQTGPFLDTAAVLQCVDLTIAADTAVAHLAGALGVPVWVALTHMPDWRWLLDRDDSPWYPTMRLFRQVQPGNWVEVFERIAAALPSRLRLANSSSEPQAASRKPRALRIPIAPGELIDKLTILEIKEARMTDAAKLRNVRHELAILVATRDRTIPPSARLDQLAADLKAVNEALWDIEDDIRACERQRDFGEKFIALARSVYRQNDRRAALKRQINELLGSSLIEEKSYAAYE